MVKNDKDKKRSNFIRVNEKIKIREVLLIHEGNNLGVVKTSDALSKARLLGLDLVEVSPYSKPPVCSIIEYGKFMYDKQKKNKVKKSVSNKEKELSFRYVIDNNDLKTKANQARAFIKKGQKVKLLIKFKHREKAHKDKGFAALKKIIEMVEDIAVVEKEPGFEGNSLTARLGIKTKDKE